jgi:glycosyltransferase involved in cell wall biosynthesis
VIPTYNVEKFVRRTLRSIKMQSFQDINVIVVDASTDCTKEVVVKELKDVRFEWKLVEQNSHGGVSNATNIGLKIASGEYIHFLDGDDFIEPTFYEKCIIRLLAKLMT